MYMNIAYRYMEARKERDSIAVYPFIDSLSHHATTRDLQRRITAPDMEPHPSVLLVEGDFTTVFADQNSHYDVIVTHFFIDTARNLMSYFETIHRLLKTGGHWVNFGPLLYGTGPFVQLSLDEILAVLEKMGFEFEELDEQQCGNLTFEGQRIRWKEAEYGFNVRALTSSAYKAQTWLARKV
jgi:carnosine N-methyltransferase